MRTQRSSTGIRFDPEALAAEEFTKVSQMVWIAIRPPHAAEQNGLRSVVRYDNMRHASRTAA
jgi:hypothetical protein